MNNVTIIGELKGMPEIIYTSDKGKKLYKITLGVKKYAKTEDARSEDVVNVKVWDNVLRSEFDLYDHSVIGIEGKVSSFSNADNTAFYNEIIANKIINLD